MVLPGLACTQQDPVEAVATATVGCLRRTVPAAVAGIAFLSGGQPGELASARLNAMNAKSAGSQAGGLSPWPLVFSFARPDALRFVAAVSAALGWPMAVASSSNNANAMLQQIRLADGRNLLGLFQANVCGRDLRHGKPDPEIFQLAAKELHAMPGQCFVMEDAPAGVQATRAGGMAALGVARLHDQAGLQAAHADMVVTSLDEVRLEALAGGRLCRRPA